MHIKTLHIFSSNLEEQVAFYSNVLGLDMIQRNDHQVSLKIGKPTLCIEYKPKATPYHFAINIPSNKEDEALKWLESRVTILRDGENEIQDFDYWNAKAIYFYDKDQNIVEFIARKNLDNTTNSVFNVNQMLEISEIGLPTVDVEREFKILNQFTDIEIFDGGFERFCAIGDEHGLFICVNKNVKKWFPTDDEAYSSDFKIELIEKGNTYQFIFENEKLNHFH
ncbi:VOC family protein [Salibacteraceae bacterium]|nr:VOC family protein [Salibacteraceae bacterium]